MAETDLSGLHIDKNSAEPGRKRRWPLWIILGLMLAGLLAALWFSGLLTPAASVRTVAVSRIHPYQTFTALNAAGYVVAQRKAAVASKVTGKLVWLGVEEGSRVSGGEVIARLENDDVTAGLERARANLDVARHELDVALAELSDARSTFVRYRNLVRQEVVSRNEFDNVQARYRRAMASVEARRAGLRAAESALEQAGVALEDTFIRAPFDAVVLTKNADVGDIVTPIGSASDSRASVVTIADMESLQVEADVSESNIGGVRVGQPTMIRLDALPDDHFPGKVHMVVPTADRSKASVMVKVAFTERDPRILPEMSAKVAFLSRAPEPVELEAVVAVPVSAVVGRDGGEAVFLLREGRAERVSVRLGRTFGDYRELLGGVEEGSRVVVEPPEGLEDGSRAEARTP